MVNEPRFHTFFVSGLENDLILRQTKELTAPLSEQLKPGIQITEARVK